MKKKAESTSPVSGRVNGYVKAKLLKGAAVMEMSMSQYVSHALTTYMSGEDTQKLQDRLMELSQELKVLQQQIEADKSQPWKQEPYATLLQKVMHNERVLEELFVTYDSQPVPVALLKERSFHSSVLLSSEKKEGKPVYYTGTYGWMLADAKNSVIILKRS
jgi:hypothetical protein